MTSGKKRGGEEEEEKYKTTKYKSNLISVLEECDLRHVVNVQVSGKALYSRVWYNTVTLKHAMLHSQLHANIHVWALNILFNTNSSKTNKIHSENTAAYKHN